MGTFNSEELRTGYCSICGDKIGMGFNHDECAQAKKEIYGESDVNKHPHKKLSKKETDYLGKKYSKF
jgi:uncharacterized Fe-S cluster protein YjdI